jgi:hypothetical protein
MAEKPVMTACAATGWPDAIENAVAVICIAAVFVAFCWAMSR